MEKQAIEDAGGQMIFTDGEVFSSTKMLNNIGVGLNTDQKAYRDFLYAIADINKNIDQLKDLSVLVIGDTILDEYTYCSCLTLFQNTQLSQHCTMILK